MLLIQRRPVLLSYQTLTAKPNPSGLPVLAKMEPHRVAHLPACNKQKWTKYMKKSVHGSGYQTVNQNDLQEMRVEKKGGRAFRNTWTYWPKGF